MFVSANKIPIYTLWQKILEHDYCLPHYHVEPDG